jgi:hypothetical protein
MAVTLNKRKLEQMIRTTPDKVDAFGRAVATEMVNEIVLSYGTSSGYRTYRHGSVVHTSSHPGYPPNVDIGTLRASMRWSADGKYRWLIHDGVIYGIWLEQGTAKMAARPHVAPVFEEWKQRRLAEYAKAFGLLA